MRRDEERELRRLYERLQQAEGTLDAQEIEFARAHPSNFIELVGLHQWPTKPDGSEREPWERLEQAPIHEDMQRHMSESNRLLIKSFPGAGKTTQVALRQVWELGHDVERRLLVLSQHVSASDPSVKLSRLIRSYCESPLVRQIFPDLVPTRMWSDFRWTLKRRSASDDPTCRTMHLWGSPTGGRPNVIIFDDLYDSKVVRSEADGRKILNWVLKSVLSRFGINQQTEVIWLTNAWHDRDPAVLLEESQQELEQAGRERRWRVVEYPLLDSCGKSLHPELVPDDLVPHLRDEFGEQFAPLFELKTLRDDQRAFTIEVLDRVFRDDVRPVERLDDDALDEDQMVVVVGVDPAGGKKKRRGKGDRTALVVDLYDYDSGLERTLWATSGRWVVNRTARMMLEVQLRYWPESFVCEDNGVQNWLEEIVRLEHENLALRAELDGELCPYVLPRIVPHTTGREKHDPHVGVRSMVTEFRSGRHLIPSTRVAGRCRDAITRLRDGLYAYTETAHTADELMAKWFARTRIRALVARRRLMASSSGARVRAVSTPDMVAKEKERERRVMSFRKSLSGSRYDYLR